MIRGFVRHRGLCNVVAAAAFVVVSSQPAHASLLALGKLDANLAEIAANPLASVSKVRVIASARPGQLASLLLTLRLSGITVLAEHQLIEAVTIELPRLLVTALSGTSMAAAVTTGVIALALEAHRTSEATSLPPRTPNAVKAVLQLTAFSLDAAGRTPDAQLAYGAGRINAAGATDLASRLDTNARLGDPWLTSGVNATSDIGRQLLSWSQHIVWGSHIVWGDSVYFKQHAFTLGVAWGSHIVWGDTHFTEGTVAWRNVATSRTTPANTLTAWNVQP